MRKWSVLAWGVALACFFVPWVDFVLEIVGCLGLVGMLLILLNACMTDIKNNNFFIIALKTADVWFEGCFNLDEENEFRDIVELNRLQIERIRKSKSRLWLAMNKVTALWICGSFIAATIVCLFSVSWAFPFLRLWSKLQCFRKT